MLNVDGWTVGRTDGRTNERTNGRKLARLCLPAKAGATKRGITLSKNIGGLPPLLVWVPLLIVNNYSEFQVNIFSNNKDIRKSQSVRTTADDDDVADDDARALIIPRRFL